jgi:pimeloyl-ACP methyl ester carboxylesterase
LSPLALSRRGDGPPLVLLHGLGSSRRAWEPVIPTLAAQFDVLAVDLPGFGDSAQLPPEIEPDPRALARAVANALDGWGIEKAHVAGNSLGGWVALELAEIWPVASLTLLSPAGLWAGGTPMYCRASLRALRWLARHAEPWAFRLANYRLGRALLFVQIFGQPSRLTPDEARHAVHALGASPGFDATLTATTHRHYQATRSTEVPVTVAFGSRDRLLLRRQSRHLEQLPAEPTIASLPGCGHVPMADDPCLVARLIVDSASHAQALAARQLP